MTTINLKDFYSWYTHDEYIEVSDEVAAELRADKLYELAHQRRYLLRDDVLDVTLYLNDRELECDRAPFYLPEDGLYYTYFHFYEPTRNHYIGANLVHDKYFYNVMVVIDEENAIYAASISDEATRGDFDLPKPFTMFLDDHQNG